MKRTTARRLRSVLTSLWLMLALILLPFAWLLRDGLGPGAVSSSGWDAVLRSLGTFYIGHALGFLLLAVIGAWVVSCSPDEGG